MPNPYPFHDTNPDPLFKSLGNADWTLRRLSGLSVELFGISTLSYSSIRAICSVLLFAAAVLSSSSFAPCAIEELLPFFLDFWTLKNSSSNINFCLQFVNFHRKPLNHSDVVNGSSVDVSLCFLSICSSSWSSLSLISFSAPPERFCHVLSFSDSLVCHRYHRRPDLVS